MTTNARIFEYHHLNPDGCIHAKDVGEYLACTITNGFTEARYVEKYPYILWHECIANFITSIIAASNLDLAITVSALILIKDYQATLERADQCRVDEVEDVMRLFVSAYIVADTVMSGDADRIRLTNWKRIVAGEWTMLELGKGEHAFRRVLQNRVEIRPAAHSWNFFLLIENHDIIRQANLQRAEAEEEQEQEQERMQNAEEFSHSTTPSRGRPLRVTNFCSADLRSLSLDKKSSKSSTGSLIILVERSCHVRTASAGPADDLVFSEVTVPSS